MKRNELLSVVLPAYNEERNIDRIIARLTEVLRQAEIPFELIFVNDGSRDGTWDSISRAHQARTDVVGINLSRNFGKEAAILAGLRQAGGACCVVMDCDLQHPPEIVPEMYRLWRSGYDTVAGIKRVRGRESAFHRFCARIFYSCLSRATRMDMARASDFRLLDRKVVDALTHLPERSPFFRALSSWVGYKTTQVEYDVAEREDGKSSWSFLSLARYAIRNLVSFTSAPLKLVSVIGALGLVVTLILGIQTLVRYLMGRSVEGFTTVILLLLGIGSLVLISLGIIGLYLAQMYEEVKHRPLYLIEETLERKTDPHG